MTLAVLVNATSARHGGGLSYLVRQLGALAAIDDIELDVVAAPWNVDALRAAGLTCQVVPIGGRWSRIVWELVGLRRLARGHDVAYHPGNFVPLTGSPVPTVLAIQNPNYFGTGPAHSHNRRPVRRLAAAACRHSLRRATRVVVISQALLEAMSATAGVRPDARYHVVLSGQPDWSEVNPQPVAGLDPDGGHVLVLANEAAHKQLPDAIRGWERAAEALGARAPHLVLAGRLTDPTRALAEEVAARHAGCVHVLGPVADPHQIRWLLERAFALLAPASLEAYPLTPEEAIVLGVRPILSDIPPHREVAGENADYFPLGDVPSIADAIVDRVDGRTARRVIHHPSFTWAQHAEQLADVLRSAAGR